jgi:hypothetical protein
VGCQYVAVNTSRRELIWELGAGSWERNWAERYETGPFQLMERSAGEEVADREPSREGEKPCAWVGDGQKGRPWRARLVFW